MRKLNFTGLLLALAIMLALAACGGSGAGLDTPALEQATTTAATEAAATDTDGMPAIPYDIGAAKALSTVGDPPPPPGGEQTFTVLGQDFVQQQNGVVDGDALVLSAPAVSDGVDDAAGAQLAYATYRVSGMAGRRALSLNIECLPAQLGQAYFVGVADYTNFKWRWFGPVALPEFQLDLRGHNQQFVTQLGNMYFILVCRPGNGATHYKTSVLTVPRDGQGLPGGPHHLEASDGALNHKIALNWQAGLEAEHYDILRKPARQDAQWEKIGESAATEFIDQPVPNGVLFFYHVVARNGNGNSARSNVDAGFASDAPGVRVVQGEVARINGEPVPGIRVVLVGRGEEAMCLTNAEGKYKFFGLPAGRYIVAPVHPELDFAPAYAIADVRSELVAELHFNAIPEAPFHRIKGFAYEFAANADPGLPPLFQPLAGLEIKANLTGQPDNVITVTTDDNGFYHFEDLAEGVYLVRAVKEGYGFFPPVHEVVVNGHNRPDRRDFLGFPTPPADDGGGDGGDSTL